MYNKGIKASEKKLNTQEIKILINRNWGKNAVLIIGWKCSVCGYTWIPKNRNPNKKPKICGYKNCKSKYWDK